MTRDSLCAWHRTASPPIACDRFPRFRRDPDDQSAVESRPKHIEKHYRRLLVLREIDGLRGSVSVDYPRVIHHDWCVNSLNPTCSFIFSTFLSEIQFARWRGIGYTITLIRHMASLKCSQADDLGYFPLDPFQSPDLLWQSEEIRVI
jgi:hypothetical protein